MKQMVKNVRLGKHTGRREMKISVYADVMMAENNEIILGKSVNYKNKNLM